MNDINTDCFEVDVNISDFTLDVSISSEVDEEPELINVEKDTDDSGLEDVADKAYNKFIEKSFQVIKRVEEIGLPAPNHQL